MNFFVISVILLATVVAVYSESISNSENGEESARIFLSTFTVILSTVTSTTTTTSVTTCTIPPAMAPSICTPARRRRGILYDENGNSDVRQGLFHQEGDEIFQDGSTLLSSSSVKRSAEPNENSNNGSNSFFETTNSIPLTIQSGFSLPEGFPMGTPRFKLAYGTTTLTTTMTSISTRALQAFCLSTTQYSVCANIGK